MMQVKKANIGNKSTEIDENIIKIIQRIAKIRFVFCQNNNLEFSEKLGKNPTLTSQICSGSKNPGKKFLQLITDTFPSVSKSWLYFGEEPMIIDNHGDIKGNTAGGDIMGNGAIKTTDADYKELINIISSQQKTIERLSFLIK